MSAPLRLHLLPCSVQSELLQCLADMGMNGRAGEDLLQASADKPFRFPATFTFVVRSFTVLDGIGKSLSPRFDMTEIAAPYARNLILEARPQIEKAAQEFRKRLDRQVYIHLFIFPPVVFCPQPVLFLMHAFVPVSVKGWQLA